MPAIESAQFFLPTQQIAVCASGTQSDPTTRPKRTLNEALGAAFVEVRAGPYGESGLGGLLCAGAVRPGFGRVRKLGAWAGRLAPVWASLGARGGRRWTCRGSRRSSRRQTRPSRWPGGYRQGRENGTAIMVKRCRAAGRWRSVTAASRCRTRPGTGEARGRGRRRRSGNNGGDRRSSVRAGDRGSREEGARAGCGKSACPVRRVGGRPPYPYLVRRHLQRCRLWQEIVLGHFLR